MYSVCSNLCRHKLKIRHRHYWSISNSIFLWYIEFYKSYIKSLAGTARTALRRSRGTRAPPTLTSTCSTCTTTASWASPSLRPGSPSTESRSSRWRSRTATMRTGGFGILLTKLESEHLPQLFADTGCLAVLSHLRASRFFPSTASFKQTTQVQIESWRLDVKRIKKLDLTNI